MTNRIRVLVVDDSAFNRRTITKMLETVPEVYVVGYATDGEEALRKVFELKPDLITLDLEMPRMDGFTFLRILMQNRPTPVIVVSARSEDENVFRALEFGAVEFVAKPSGRISPELVTIQEDLIRKVRGIYSTDMNKILRRTATPAPVAPPRWRSRTVLTPPARQGTPERLVVIGASTGGPPALQKVLAAIDRSAGAGFAVAQHMPPGFTRAFAERLNRFCSLEIREAATGDVLGPGVVLIAPGGKNLALRRRDDHVIIAHVMEPAPEQRYVPSVDILFESAGELGGLELTGVVLTGMGNDGSRGVTAIKRCGGSVIAEAEETSVVFGMPKEAIATGQVDRILPLPEISGEILRRCGS